MPARTPGPRRGRDQAPDLTPDLTPDEIPDPIPDEVPDEKTDTVGDLTHQVPDRRSEQTPRRGRREATGRTQQPLLAPPGSVDPRVEAVAPQLDERYAEAPAPSEQLDEDDLVKLLDRLEGLDLTPTDRWLLSRQPVFARALQQALRQDGRDRAEAVLEFVRTDALRALAELLLGTLARRGDAVEWLFDQGVPVQRGQLQEALVDALFGDAAHEHDRGATTAAPVLATGRRGGQDEFDVPRDDRREPERREQRPARDVRDDKEKSARDVRDDKEKSARDARDDKEKEVRSAHRPQGSGSPDVDTDPYDEDRRKQQQAGWRSRDGKRWWSGGVLPCVLHGLDCDHDVPDDDLALPAAFTEPLAVARSAAFMYLFSQRLPLFAAMDALSGQVLGGDLFVHVDPVFGRGDGLDEEDWCALRSLVLAWEQDPLPFTQQQVGAVAAAIGIRHTNWSGPVNTAFVTAMEQLVDLLVRHATACCEDAVWAVPAVEVACDGVVASLQRSMNGQVLLAAARWRQRYAHARTVLTSLPLRQLLGVAGYPDLGPSPAVERLQPGQGEDASALRREWAALDELFDLVLRRLGGDLTQADVDQAAAAAVTRQILTGRFAAPASLPR